jgi:hypothetical protein
MLCIVAMKFGFAPLIAITSMAFLQTATWGHAQEAEVQGVEVTATAPEGVLRQEAPVGPYDQPWWTTERTFGTSRVYVRPPGTVEFVQHWTPEFNEPEVAHAFREEVEIGLPYRFQLDFYQNWNIEKSDAFYKGASIELRYALANWGKIPLNPTLYGEWSFNDRSSDVWEVKLLLGDTFCHRWNWAANLTYESKTGGEREREIQISQALTYALIDRTLNVGVEALWEYKTAAASNEADYEFLVGPSINVHPTRNSFVTIAPLFGAIRDSPEAEVFVVAGFQFRFGGPATEREEGPRAPASMFAR